MGGDGIPNEVWRYGKKRGGGWLWEIHVELEEKRVARGMEERNNYTNC